jgi:hypothetical protein
MIYTRFLVIAHGVVYYTEIDVGEELASYVCNFFMLLVVLNSFVKVFGVLFTHLHKVNTNAVIRKSFSMHVPDCSTNLEELFVLIYC